MGQKVNPIGFRIKDWDISFYAEGKEYGKFFRLAMQLKKFIEKRYALALISKILFQITSECDFKIIIYAVKPRLIIGDNGQEVSAFQEILKNKFNVEKVSIVVNFVHKPYLSAAVVGQYIAKQLKSGSFKSAMRKNAQDVIKNGAQGVKISCSGRLNGADIARTEWYKDGRVPLHTLRANIDYAVSEAKTKYGIIGIQVWIYKGNRKLS